MRHFFQENDKKKPNPLQNKKMNVFSLSVFRFAYFWLWNQANNEKKSNVNKCLFCVNKEPLFGIYTIYIVKSNVCTVVRSVHTKNIIQTYNQAMYFVNIRYISPQTAQNLLYVFLQLFYCFSKKKRKKLSDG